MHNFKERRKNYYIKKEFQRNFILKFCTLIVIGAILSGVIIYYYSLSTVTTTFENSRLTMKTTADFILPTILFSSAIVILLVGIATIIVTLLTSHRIAGPLFRIEKDVGEIADGDLKVRFNLRSTDEIKALAVALDVMVRNLHSKAVELKKDIATTEDAIDKNDMAKAKQGMRGIKSAAEKFRT